MNCVILFITLAQIVMIQGEGPERPHEVKMGDEPGAAAWNAQAVDPATMKFLLAGWSIDSTQFPVQDLEVDYTSGSVTAGEVIGAWRLADAPTDPGLADFPKEGDTVDYYQGHFVDIESRRIAMRVVASADSYKMRPDKGDAKKGLVIFSYPWIKKHRVNGAVPEFWENPRFAIEYVIYVRFLNKEGEERTRVLSKVGDRQGFNCFNVMKGNAESVQLARAAEAKRRDELRAAKPTRVEDVDNGEGDAAKVRTWPRATGVDVVNYLMENKFEIIGRLLQEDRQPNFFVQRIEGSDIDHLRNDVPSAGEIVSLWMGDDPIFTANGQLAQLLENSEYDLTAFFTTFTAQQFGLEALEHQQELLPRLGDTIHYFANEEDKQPSVGAVISSYRYATKLCLDGYKIGDNYIPSMEVRVRFVGPGGILRHSSLYKTAHKGRSWKERGSVVFQHRPGFLDVSDFDLKRRLHRGLFKYAERRHAPHLPDISQEDIQPMARPNQRHEGGPIDMGKLPKPAKVSVAVTENTGTPFNAFYARGFCFIVILTFLLMFYRRKPTSEEEQPLYEPLF